MSGMVFAVLLGAVLQTAPVQGVVVKEGSAPIAGATVELRTDDRDARVIASTTTDDDGRFVLLNVPPGRYRLSAERGGYVRSPMSVTVEAGRTLPDLRVTMSPTGAIFGAVYDSKGKPLGNVELRAYRATYSEGRRVLKGVQAVETNDLGEYRLFWLPPGRYYVSATHPQADSGFRLMASGGMSLAGGSTNGAFSATASVDIAVAVISGPAAHQEWYVPIYFPGTTSEGNASAIDLHASSDYGPVNIAVVPVQPHHIRGFIIDGATGRSTPESTVDVNRDPPGFAFAPRQENDRRVDPATGAFEIEVLPGPRTLTAHSGGGTGTITVDVGDADVNDVTLVTSPYFNVTGRMFSRDDIAALDMSQLRLTLRRIPPIPNEGQSRSSYSQPRLDGGFLLEASSGDFHVNVAPILNLVSPSYPEPVSKGLQTVYVKAIRFGNTDVLNGSLHLEGASTAALEIELGNKPGAVEGVTERTDSTVALIPDARGRFDLYQSVSTDPSGRFRFERIPPGNYKMFAWSEVETDSWFDAEFIQRVETRGVPVRVTEGNTSQIRVPTID
jgi:hypothetical protein